MSLTTVYAPEPFPSEVRKSLFLAGPTPREGGLGRSWRYKALELLEKLGYDGHVFIPEPRDGVWHEHYEGQVDWETEGLHRADQIVFWVPRDIEGDRTPSGRMPGFTTNDEWGAWKASGKVVWGSPNWADKVRYQLLFCEEKNVPRRFELGDTLEVAVKRIGEGSFRTGGEASIPLHVWRKPEFQAWYKAQTGAGHRLLGGKVLWSFWPNANFMFSSVVHVRMDIAGENRVKENEFIFTRSDVSAVVMFHRPDKGVPEVVLVREYRSPARNDRGFVFELPSGSSLKEGEDPLVTASHEVEEETGFFVEPSRFTTHGARQLVSTLSIHTAALFSVELTSEEMARLKEDNGPHGVSSETERTYVEVFPLTTILSEKLVDWTTLGMILSVLQ